MPGGNVYKDHTFNKETTHTSHEFSQYNTVHMHNYNTSTWTLQNTRNRKYRKNTENTKKNTESTNVLPGNEPGPSSLIARHYIVWTTPTQYVNNFTSLRFTSPHFTSLLSPYFTSLIFTFLTLFLKYLSPFVGTWPLFHFLNPKHSR
jgi:hypothetical protein